MQSSHKRQSKTKNHLPQLSHIIKKICVFVMHLIPGCHLALAHLSAAHTWDTAPVTHETQPSHGTPAQLSTALTSSSESSFVCGINSHIHTHTERAYRTEHKAHVSLHRRAVDTRERVQSTMGRRYHWRPCSAERVGTREGGSSRTGWHRALVLGVHGLKSFPWVIVDLLWDTVFLLFQY